MKKCFILNKTTQAMLGAAVTLFAPALAHANTYWMRGGNWGAPATSYQSSYNDIIYPDGMFSTTSQAQAATLADEVVLDDAGVAGMNTVRYPVDPGTVSDPTAWGRTQAAINELINEGFTVDICCFYIAWDKAHGGNGKIPSMSNWETMWKAIDRVYGTSGWVFYEPINEPFGYSLSELEGVYNTFFTYGLKKPKNFCILDGTGYADNVTGIGGYSPLSSCWLAVHMYPWYANHTTDAAWSTELYDRVNPYQDRTVMTEFGSETTTGLNYATVNSGNNTICFLRGMCNQLKSWGRTGSIWYPAHQAAVLGNNKRMFVDPIGSQRVYNQSAVNEVIYGFGLP